MKDLELCVYNPLVLQALQKGDYPQCVNFFEWYLIMEEADPNFLESVLWSDEAIFKPNGRVNCWNCLYLSDEKSTLNFRRRIEYAGSSSVGWHESYKRLGPYFFQGNVSADMPINISK